MSAKYLIKKESVVNFINTFTAIERHTVGDVVKGYIYTKMWIMYQNENEVSVKNGYFGHIFNTQYNLGFVSPRTDVCFTCLQITKKNKS